MLKSAFWMTSRSLLTGEFEAALPGLSAWTFAASEPGAKGAGMPKASCGAAPPPPKPYWRLSTAALGPSNRRWLAAVPRTARINTRLTTMLMTIRAVLFISSSFKDETQDELFYRRNGFSKVPALSQIRQGRNWERV